MHQAVRTSVTTRLQAALDDVLETDLATLTDRELLEDLAELYRAEARIAAARARLTVAADNRGAFGPTGAQTLPAYLYHTCRIPLGVARHQVSVAPALHHLPHTAGRLAEGDINAWHASRIAGHHSNPRARDALERDDELLATDAATLNWRLFERVVAYWAQLADRDGTEDDAQARKDRRRVNLSETFRGHWILDAHLDPVAGATVDNALRRIEKELFDTERRAVAQRLGRDPLNHELDRTPAQRRADALEEMARRAMAAPPGSRLPRPLVSILVGYETFAGRICELASGRVVAPGDVAALLDDAVIERVVFDSPARVSEISHQRRFTGALRRIIEIRDRTCTHPYCTVAAERCDIDHRIPWDAGGHTTQDNGRADCPFHNHLRQKRPDLDDP